MICGSYQMLVDHLGEEAARTLVERFGGSEMKVPMREGGVTWERLSAALGPREAARVVDAFGGERLYVPMHRSGQREALRELALRELASGKSPAEIASRIRYEGRVSTRWLYRVAAEARKDA